MTITNGAMTVQRLNPIPNPNHINNNNNNNDNNSFFSNSSLTNSTSFNTHNNSNLRLPIQQRFTSLSLQSQPSVSSQYTSSVGFPSLTLRLQQRHVFILNVVALSVAVSASWLFFSAIPALLAFKKAAESFEKLMDTTREELPHTMAAIRLSGMEISDLTMELSDLGQEITQGVQSSTRAVRVVEEGLRGLTNMASPAPVQRVMSLERETREPALAMSARNTREGIVKGRKVLQMLFSLTRFSRMVLNYLAKRAKQ